MARGLPGDMRESGRGGSVKVVRNGSLYCRRRGLWSGQSLVMCFGSDRESHHERFEPDR